MSSPRWLAVHRHRVRVLRTPFVLVLQHHLVEAPTRIAAPLVPAGPKPPTLLAPRVTVEGAAFSAVVLNMVAVPLRLLREEAPDAAVDEDAVANALDAIFRGYPVGLPYP